MNILLPSLLIFSIAVSQGEWHPTGRLDPLPEEKFDARSERYFAQLSRRRSSVPDSFDAVAEGLVTPVKRQGCGDCVAFVTAAIVETCFKKLTGNFGDYSEQQGCGDCVAFATAAIVETCFKKLTGNFGDYP